MQLTSGNAARDGNDSAFWFLGDLRRWSGAGDSGFGLRQSAAVEMKWGTHVRGETRAQWAASSQQRTISVLVSGKFRLRFRSAGTDAPMTDVVLECPGDYAVWGEGVEHWWIVEEDAVVLTVRWNEPDHLFE